MSSGIGGWGRFLRCVGAVSVMIGGAAHGQEYTATALADPGFYDFASYVNNAGQVAASREIGDGTEVVYWPTPTAPQVFVGPGITNQASAINDSAQIVGYSYLNNGTYAPMLWSGSTATQLVLPTGFEGQATGINRSGVVAGLVFSNALGIAPSAAVWIGNSVTSLAAAPNGASTGATAINNAGQVVGWVALNGLPQGPESEQAVLWSGGTFTALGSLGGKQAASAANAINDAGQIVGSSTVGNGYQATEWKNGQMLSLGRLAGSAESEATAINSAGVVVGSSFFSSVGPGTSRATIWMDGQIVDLNSLVENLPSGITLDDATSINDSGAIVVEGHDSNYEQTTYLLEPVPLPAAAGLFLSGLASLSFLRRRPQSIGPTS